MNNKDPYEILGASRQSTEKEIKKSYQKLAMKYHPDRNKEDDATERFKEINWAYNLLSDPQKKQAFDHYGHQAFDGMGGGRASESAADFGNIFDSVFKDFFGGGASGGQQRGQQRGADLRYSLEISLEQAIFGTQIDIKVPTFTRCEPCNGKGAKPGTQPVNCKQCGGVGQVRMQQGFFSIQQACPVCQGQGTLIKDPCMSCRGQGRVEKNTKVTVNIPAGVDDADRLRIPGRGQAGQHGAPNGDLYIEVHVKQHAIFQRDGSNLYIEVPISFSTAALGGSVTVPSLKGELQLKIPSGTQTHRIFKINGQGVPQTTRHTAGHLMCRVIIETPVDLTAEQKALIAKLAEMTTDASRGPLQKNWFDKVKEFLQNVKKF